MLYQIITISLILIEGLSILVSLKFLKHIYLSLSTNNTSIVFNDEKKEVLSLFEKLQELINLSIKREEHMLHTTFHLEQIEMYVKMVLSKLETLERERS
ncbi:MULTISPECIES: hypothetical protein [unclassified Candidatus Tisiphia]|uniref:hypothetical protein n=1 Tax=unclassified Candidatus Tisiphia TaxID=2996318 RepID=UPI001E70BFF2|nr:MAG: hypothetical protein LF884_02380 [Rickettsia endosymbiont of Cimex lectularius]